MTRSRTHYHHGDLRRSLLETATRMIRENGVEQLSMRKLAEQTGVSHAAPYHHFKDKNALLCAIAEAGFEDHIRQVSELPQQHPQLDPQALFERYVQNYIRYAAENPETYDLMFGKEIWKRGTPTESLRQVSRESFQRWRDWIGELQLAGVLSDRQSALRTAQVCWSTLHGLCRLMNDGIYLDRGDLEAMGKCATDMMMERKPQD